MIRHLSSPLAFKPPDGALVQLGANQHFYNMKLIPGIKIEDYIRISLGYALVGHTLTVIS